MEGSISLVAKENIDSVKFLLFDLPKIPLGIHTDLVFLNLPTQHLLLPHLFGNLPF